MSVKAKLYVANVAISQINEDATPKTGTVNMQAVSRGEENKEWASYTPSANFAMTINGSALGWFIPRIGKELIVTLEDAPVESTE